MTTSNNKGQIVQEELAKLAEHNFISKSDYKRLIEVYQAYQQQTTNKSNDMIQTEQKTLTQDKQAVEKSDYSPFDSYLTKKEQAENKVNRPIHENIKSIKPVRVSKTPEQLRERNITWLLILGVTFLLISGLVIATSSWNQMGSLLKVITLLGVSIFFLGLSGISSKFLKIEKTAFAFLTLGSLFLPIAIIGIGYFGLFGDYLTLTGEGRYWLGIICTLVPLPLYARNAYQTKSKLFIWIFYLFLSFLVGFILANFKMPIDAFFLFIMIYNACLLYVYHHFHQKKKNILKIFLDELPAFAQLNLIISTLLMLFIFDEVVFYSFNVLITALLYMVMVFVYQTKDYQFVFIALFAYGIFQLTENSILQTSNFFIYALMGVCYLIFAQIMQKNNFASKVFYYTSGIISGFAFLYVTYQGIIVRVDSRSWLMLLSYIVIAGTYLYLAQMTKKLVFRWLAPLFFYATAIQFWFLTIEPLFPDSMIISLFIFALGMFLGIGYHNHSPNMKMIQKSTYYLSIIITLLMIFTNALMLEYLETSLMLVTVSLIATYVALHSAQKKEKHLAEWIQPISCLLALYILYGKISAYMPFYRDQLGLTFHLVAAGLVLLGISVIWEKRKQKGFARASFYTGQMSYFLALYQLLVSFQGDENIVRPLILLVGIGVSYWLVRYTDRKSLWSLVALTASGFYLSLLTPFSIETLTGFVWFMLGLPIIFLLVEYYLGKYEPASKPYFFFFAQGILALLVVIIVFDQSVSHLYNESLHPIVWFVPLAIYLYTARTQIQEGLIKTAFYAGLSMLIGAIISLINYYQLMESIPFIYDWIVAAFGLIIVWMMIPPVWKRRMDWYLIPFMIVILSIVTTSFVVNLSWQLISSIGLIVATLYLLHKREWTIFTGVPLLFSIFLWETQMVFTETFSLWFIYLIGFMILVGSGKMLHEQLWWKDKQKKIGVDWYSIMAIPYLFFAITWVINNESIWLEVFALLFLVSWFFLQANRVPQPILEKVLITLGGIAFLPPYYLILNEYIHLIPELVHAELKALPALFLAIIIINKIWHHYRQVGNHIQTILLISVTIYLIADAISSATIWDALILGTLSIISLFAGMHYQIKAYFFVGIGTLLFNLIYQTRAYWGNLPWWTYLLFAGLLFIAIASYNEWKKQHEDSGQMEKRLKKIISQFKDWR